MLGLLNAEENVRGENEGDGDTLAGDGVFSEEEVRRVGVEGVMINMAVVGSDQPRTATSSIFFLF